MKLVDRIAAVIVTHREVDVSRLSKYMSDAHRSVCIRKLEEGVFAAAFALHTCSRVELYVELGGRDDLSELVSILSRFFEHVRVLRGLDAIRHLFEVAAGLDSILIGETDVLGQLEETYQEYLRKRMLKGLLKLAVERAIHVGKRVRTETGISRGPRGLGSISIIAAERILGPLRNYSVAVFGAGAMGSGLVKELRDRGVARCLVLNRTVAKAEELGRRFGCEWGPLTAEWVDKALREYDVVFTAVTTSEPVITRVPEGARVKLIVDLGVPLNTSPNLPVPVITIESLRPIAEEFNAARVPEIEKARAIIEEEIATFTRLAYRRYVEQHAAEFMETVFSIARTEAEKSGCACSGLPASSAAKRVAYIVLDALKDLAESGQIEVVDAVLNAVKRRLATT